jgi:SAM-dependent methyltransferase
MVEIDQTFLSLDEWLTWAAKENGVYVAAEADLIAGRVLSAGFTEPLTQRLVSPRDIDGTDRNWREGLVAFNLNSRLRAVMSLIERTLTAPRHMVRIFATEAITPFALMMRGIFPRFLGAEYARDESAKRALYPIEHQDLTALTLPSDSFDIVTTNEVLEHVPDLDAALREIARVLTPGGWHIGTHPFRFMNANSEMRSRLQGGKILHLMAPEIHGNPVDPDGGSLVFETPGWDIIPRAHAAGFSEAHMRFVASEKNGYVTQNTGVFVLCAQK